MPACKCCTLLQTTNCQTTQDAKRSDNQFSLFFFSFLFSSCLFFYLLFILSSLLLCSFIFFFSLEKWCFKGAESVILCTCKLVKYVRTLKFKCSFSEISFSIDTLFKTKYLHIFHLKKYISNILNKISNHSTFNENALLFKEFQSTR